MRRRIQQVGRQLVERHTSLLVFAVATLVYLLTMDRSASWWDCGEFIATGYGLQVGHPPGAPTYQLITHLFMLLSFGHVGWVAPLSNLVSVLCGGLTVMLLYLTILLLSRKASRLGAGCGAGCYLFCDTAWFSAVESEVYSMAMLVCALAVWLMLRWEREGDGRKLLLTALTLGLGVGVHLMTLLVTPALLWLFIRRMRRCRGAWPLPALRVMPLCLVFFLLGLTTYAVIPIRAASNPPINEGNPATAERFRAYVGRDQYPKAPLYPRLWRDRDRDHWQSWGATDEGLWSNTKYYFAYQLGYMYCRYIMYNFIGRENLRWHLPVLSVLPFLLGLWGIVAQWKRRQRGRLLTVALLFLFGGIILNLYLNHPCYEPRERDYAYVLSFYTFAIWIGIGAGDVRERFAGHRKRTLATAVLVAAPLLLAAGNWSDHDRHNCHSVHDISLNHLQSCDHGAILLTLGDNDTFPLWYLQHVEHRRTDVSVYNINLVGFRRTMEILEANDFRRPVYLSHYLYRQYGRFFGAGLRCEGFCWRVLPQAEADSSDNAALRRHINDSIEWNITPGEYVDHISRSFLSIWKENTGDQVQ